MVLALLMPWQAAWPAQDSKSPAALIAEVAISAVADAKQKPDVVPALVSVAATASVGALPPEDPPRESRVAKLIIELVDAVGGAMLGNPEAIIELLRQFGWAAEFDLVVLIALAFIALPRLLLAVWLGFPRGRGRWFDGIARHLGLTKRRAASCRCSWLSPSKSSEFWRNGISEFKSETPLVAWKPLSAMAYSDSTLNLTGQQCAGITIVCRMQRSDDDAKTLLARLYQFDAEEQAIRVRKLA